MFFETVNWNSAALFLCRHLEQRRPCSCALYDGSSIIWVVNASADPSGSAQSPSGESLREAVADIARTYACKAGVSDEFDDFSQLLTCYAEAETALTIGQAKDPHFWYYLFDDYLLDYLVQKSTETYPAERLASKKLLELMRIDAVENTDYVEVLHRFLANKQNATRTAHELYMHRTSLLRKLERLQARSGIDFDDPDEMLYLLLSFKMLEEGNAF